MVNTDATVYFLSTTYRPVGGVLKLFDYVEHAKTLGLRVVVCVPEPYRDDYPVFRVPGLEDLRASFGVEYRDDFRIAPGPKDFVYFSWPTHFPDIARRLPAGFPLERVIHIVQNVRHANASWVDGYALRLLARPMTRIVINEQVLAAIDPYRNTRCPARVIPLGHRADYFARTVRGGLPRPVKVAYTSWKSSVGEAVAERLAGDSRFKFRGVRGVVGWPELRKLYHWCDVFLGCPNAEEGFYLPGLEAMAAGAVVLVPDVGGNLAYCRFGENCLQVRFDDADDYVRSLTALLGMDATEIERLRQGGYRQVAEHSLAHERDEFAVLLGELEDVARPWRVPWLTAPPARHEPASAPRRHALLTGVPRAARRSPPTCSTGSPTHSPSASRCTRPATCTSTTPTSCATRSRTSSPSSARRWPGVASPTPRRSPVATPTTTSSRGAVIWGCGGTAPIAARCRSVAS